MGKTPFKLLSLVSLFLLTLVFASAAGPPTRIGELSQKIEDVQKKITACGSDSACANRYLTELMALEAEYHRLAGGPPPFKMPVPGQESESPTCASFFKPGWSCLPVKVKINGVEEMNITESFPDPPGSLKYVKYYVKEHWTYAYSAEATGILTYTRDFLGFELRACSSRQKSRINQLQGYSKWYEESPPDYVKVWKQEPIPKGQVSVRIPAAFSIKYGMDYPVETNVRVQAVLPQGEGVPSDWIALGIYPEDDVNYVVTPDMIKSAIAAKGFSKTLHYRLTDEQCPGEKGSYVDNKVDITVEIGSLPSGSGRGSSTSEGSTTEIPGSTTTDQGLPDDAPVGTESEWEVTITGDEVQETQPYWTSPLGLKGSIGFVYGMKAKFKVAKGAAKWIYSGGKITEAGVDLNNLYEPQASWELKPFQCQGCSNVESLAGGNLTGTLAGDNIKFSWGKVVPSASVSARIIAGCTQMPGCGQWKARPYASEKFFDVVSGVTLPMKEGTKTGQWTGALDRRWVHYTYTLKRLD